jgi:Recombination endonuclease VII
MESWFTGSNRWPMPQTRCVDCTLMGRSTTRAALKPGPRCEEHWRAEKQRRAKVAHGHRIELEFGITSDQYWAIYEAQGGSCFICRRATGRKKRLAVDHDHHKGCGHHPSVGCPRCIRALLCSPCNQILGRLDEDGLRRAIHVLNHAPAQQVLLSLDR